MSRRRRKTTTYRKSKARRRQILAFFLGVLCSVPAATLADELDNILDLVVEYRMQRRAAENSQSLGTFAGSIVKTEPLKASRGSLSRDKKAVELSAKREVKKEVPRNSLPPAKQPW